MVVSVIMFNVHNWKGVYMSSGMFGYVDVLKTAADASWAREEVLTNNIANVDTPNYKRQDVVAVKSICSCRRPAKVGLPFPLFRFTGVAFRRRLPEAKV